MSAKEFRNPINTQTPGQHLSDEQFADLLLGAKPASVQEHLKACAQCADEAERVAGAIGSFEQQSRLWAERRAATHAALTPELALAPAWLRMLGGMMLRPQAWAAVAVAAAITVAVSVSMNMGGNRQQRAPEQTVASAQQQPAVVHPAVPGTEETAAAQSAAPVVAVVRVPQARLKADNQLLSAIDGELRADDSTTAGLYGLNVSSPMERTRNSERIAN